jgi:hypothetical protein
LESLLPIVRLALVILLVKWKYQSGSLPPVVNILLPARIAQQNDFLMSQYQERDHLTLFMKLKDPAQ